MSYFTMDPSPIVQRLQEVMQNAQGGVLIVAIVPPRPQDVPLQPPQVMLQPILSQAPSENQYVPPNSQQSLDNFLMRMLQDDS